MVQRSAALAIRSCALVIELLTQHKFKNTILLIIHMNLARDYRVRERIAFARKQTLLWSLLEQRAGGGAVAWKT